MFRELLNGQTSERFDLGIGKVIDKIDNLDVSAEVCLESDNKLCGAVATLNESLRSRLGQRKYLQVIDEQRRTYLVRRLE